MTGAGPRIASGLKPLMLLVGVAAAIAVGVGVMLWAIGPTYSLLYANLAPEEAAQITQALDSARIEASMKDGVVRLRIPKQEHARPRRIEVRAS
jgi:flagellar M-ring protein FliF